MHSNLKFIISILFFKPRNVVGSTKVITVTSSGPAAPSARYTSAAGEATVYTPPTEPPAATITRDPYVYRRLSNEQEELEMNYPQPPPSLSYNPGGGVTQLPVPPAVTTPDPYGFRSEQPIGNYDNYPPPPPC